MALKPISIKVCPVCGEINQYDWRCDNDRAHPGVVRPELVSQTFYPRNYIAAEADEFANGMAPGRAADAVLAFTNALLG